MVGKAEFKVDETMEIIWKKWDENDKTPLLRWYLVRIGKSEDGQPAAVVLAYLKEFFGKKEWIHPGIPRNTSKPGAITHYGQLPKNFNPPGMTIK